jgi:hypothetical protein
MRQAVTFTRRTSKWELLSQNVAPLLPQLPFLRESVAELDSLIVEAKALDSEQEEARGRLQDVIHRRQAVERRGENLRRRVTSHLRGVFGFASQQLLQFGVRPHKSGPRGPRAGGRGLGETEKED